MFEPVARVGGSTTSTPADVTVGWFGAPPPFPAGVDPALDELLAEEQRLRQLLASQVVALHAGEARLSRARVPDPQIGEYMSSLGQGVVLEGHARQAGSIVDVARTQLEVAQESLRSQQEEQRSHERRLTAAQALGNELSRKNTATRCEIAVVEARLKQARGKHGRLVADKHVATERAQDLAQCAEAQAAPLELQAAQLESEVRWCRMLRGEAEDTS